MAERPTGGPDRDPQHVPGASAKRRPLLVTVLAAVGVIIATSITLPANVQSLRLDEGGIYSGAARGLWNAAFWIGSASLAMALVALGQERRRGSRTGRNLARFTILGAGIGTIVWFQPLLNEPT